MDIKHPIENKYMKCVLQINGYSGPRPRVGSRGIAALALTGVGDRGTPNSQKTSEEVGRQSQACHPESLVGHCGCNVRTHIIRSHRQKFASRLSSSLLPLLLCLCLLENGERTLHL